MQEPLFSGKFVFRFSFSFPINFGIDTNTNVSNIKDNTNITNMNVQTNLSINIRIKRKVSNIYIGLRELYEKSKVKLIHTN